MKIESEDKETVHCHTLTKVGFYRVFRIYIILLWNALLLISIQFDPFCGRIEQIIKGLRHR
jgi:hypothetical protein